MRISGAGNTGHRIILGSVAEYAAPEGRSLSGQNDARFFVGWEFKGVAAKHREIMWMPVVALARVVLGKEPAEER